MAPDAASRSVSCRRLFDGHRVLDDVDVHMADGRVVDVRPLEMGTPVHPVAFAMPGLVDAHVHAVGDGNFLPTSPSEFSIENTLSQVEAFARLCLLAGVTTVRDTGNHLVTVEHLRQLHAQGRGPRVFASGPLIDRVATNWRFTRPVADQTDARAAVRELARAGVDFVSVYRTLHEDLLGVVAAEAESAALPVALNSRRIAASVAAEHGARSIEHVLHCTPAPAGHELDAAELLASWADADLGGPDHAALATQLAKTGTYVVPTMVVTRRWALLDEVINEPLLPLLFPVLPYHRHLAEMRNPWGRRIGRRMMGRKGVRYRELDRDGRRRVDAGYRRLCEHLVALHDAGVPLAAGSDAPNPSVVPGFGLHRELQHLVDAGLAPLDALRSATSVAADLLGRPDLGRVVAGSRADLLLLNRDPTVDVHAMGTVAGVIVDGRTVDIESLRRWVAEVIEEL